MVMIKERFLGGCRRLLSLLLLMAIVVSCLSGLTLSTNASARIRTNSQANSLLKQGASRGIDVSKWQGRINWSQVAQDDVDFVFVRASCGSETDPYFVANAQGAYNQGLKVGAYHYAHFNSTESMRKEAALFVRQLKRVNINYPVVLDLERNPGLSRTQLTRLALDFIRIVENQGYTVMFYSYQNFIDGQMDKAALQKAGTKMWVANYITYPKGIPHQIWQHTSRGSVKGISGHVDINVAHSGYRVNKAPKYQPLARANDDGTDRSSPLPRFGDAAPSAPTVTKVASAPPAETPTKVATAPTQPAPIKVASASLSGGQSATPKTVAQKPAETPKTTAPSAGPSISMAAHNGAVDFLNSTYDTTFEKNKGFSMKAMEAALAHGLAEETGQSSSFTDRDFLAMAQRDFDDADENGNFTRLLQSKLVYKGYYKGGELSGKLCSHTQDALKAFQKDQSLEQTGTFDLTTLMTLLSQ